MTHTAPAARMTDADARAADLDTFDDVTVINGKTARAWEVEARRLEDEARGAHRESADSFERCDTDGFLSQWASDTMGRLYASRARLARNHGAMAHRVLFDLDGNVISTRQVETRYGWSWVVENDHPWIAAGGKKWISESEAASDDKRIANNAKKGVQVGAVMVRGTMQNRGGNYLSVNARFIADDDALTAGDYTIITTCSRYHD